MGWKICPKCETNMIKDAEEFCKVCLNEINNKRNANNQTKNIKVDKIFQEEFTFLCELKNFRGKTGYIALNSKNEEVGIVFMCDDMRTPSYMNCELCIYPKFQNKYGEWHRIKSHGARIKWEDLRKILNERDYYKVYID